MAEQAQAQGAEGLTKEESDLLVAAMLTSHLDGDEEAVQALAQLAQDPARVREALAEVKKGGGEQPQPAGVKHIRVKASPFWGRRPL